MLEYRIDVLLAGDVPDRLAEFPRVLDPTLVFRRADLRHLAPAVEILAINDALGAESEHVLPLALIGDDADGVGARRRANLHAKHPQAARGAPDQHVITGLEGVRRMAEQHAVG